MNIDFLKKFRFFAAICIISLLASIFQVSESEAQSASPKVLFGDVNRDNEVNSLDFAALRLSLLGINSNIDLLASDVNNDEMVNSLDFAVLRGFLLGTIGQLPYSKGSSATPTPTRTSTVTSTPNTTPTPNTTTIVDKEADEFDVLRAKWLEMLNGGNSFSPTDTDYAPKVKQVESSANARYNKLNKDSNRTYIFSNFQDLNVSSNITQTYNELRTMAIAVSTRGCSQYGNAAWKAEIINALKWMVDNNWYNSKKSQGSQGNGNNWWDWEIGIPLAVQDILCILYDDLSGTDLFKEYLAAIDKFTPDPNRCNFGQVSTGANRAWVCSVVARRGILGKSSEKIATTRDATAQLFINVISSDGFYEDGSFIQHEAVAYTQGYGVNNMYELSWIIYLLDGSKWQINNPDVSNAYRWVYESFEPLVFDGRMFGAGTSNSGATGASRTNSLIRSLAYLSHVAPDKDAAYFKSLIKNYVNALTVEPFYSSLINTVHNLVLVKGIMNDPSVSPRGPLEKYKQYNSMDRVYQQRPTYGIGINMYSNRIRNYESVGNPGNNIKGWHQGDGWMELANADKTQYTDNFWPTVDSYRLPGTTVLQNSTVPQRKTSSCSWVGGTDINGIFGVTGMQLKTPGQNLSANKGWFMFDNEIVCLGSGITSTDNKVVETIVENRKINNSGNNALLVNGTQKSSSLGWSETMNEVRWAYLTGDSVNSSIGYYFPEGASLKGLREARTGSWSEISGAGSETKYTRNFLTMWLDHGSNPSGKTYSYVLLPSASSSEVSNYSSNPDITILENSSEAMAVKENKLGVVGVNFWNDTLKTVDIITSNKKAAVMTKENAQKDIEISVCDTTQLNYGTIDITINKPATGIVSKDSAITVTQLSPTIKFSVNVRNARGKSFKVKFNTAKLEDITKDIKSWEFTSNTEGWSGSGVSGFAWQTGGYIGGNLSSDNPLIKSPDNLGINADNSKLVVRMKNNTVATRGKLYFITSSDTNWNEAKSKIFSITANDSEYRDYTIDMSNISGWTGELKQLRLDPIDQSGVSSGAFDIDYIKIQQSASSVDTPIEEPIEQPIEQPEDNKPLDIKVWEFSSTIENWTATSGVNSFAWQTGGYVGGKLSSNDPQLRSPDNLDFNIDSNKTIVIRMKNSTSAQKGKIYFTTSSDKSWNEAKSRSFNIEANDPDYRDYIIDMSGISGWTGTLKQIRLDPTDQSSISSGAFSIDLIVIR